MRLMTKRLWIETYWGNPLEWKIVGNEMQDSHRPAHARTVATLKRQGQVQIEVTFVLTKHTLLLPVWKDCDL